MPRKHMKPKASTIITYLLTEMIKQEIPTLKGLLNLHHTYIFMGVKECFIYKHERLARLLTGKGKVTLNKFDTYLNSLCMLICFIFTINGLIWLLKYFMVSKFFVVVVVHFPL